MTVETFKPTRWVGYTRVSTETQADDGGGLEVQADAIKRWVRARGDKLVHSSCDAGVSGTMQYMDQRLGLREAVDYVRADKADGIVVYRLDRIGRGPLVQESVLYDLTNWGGRLASVNDAENDVLSDTYDPTRILFRQMLFAWAEYERGMIRARMSAGKERKKAMGGFLGGTIPYGYELTTGKELRENAGEMAAIAQALTMRQMGVPYRVIGEFFVGSNIRLRRGTRWHTESIRGVLNRAEERGYPQPARLTNLAKAYVGLPMDAQAV